jgi:copper ion binding protein
METATFKIGSMSCGHCQKRVQDTLMNIDGVSKAVVNLEKGEAVVEYDELKTSADALKNAVADAGYEV